MKHAERTNMGWILAALLALLFVLSLAWFLNMIARVDKSGWILILSGLLLSVPLALLFGSVGVLIEAVRQRRKRGGVSGRLAKWIYWIPRIVGISIELFFAAYALDVFNNGISIRQPIVVFIMHALPAIILGGLLAIAWRWEWVGAAVFLLPALFFLRFLFVYPSDALGMLLLFIGPMLVIAAAFWLNWQWRGEIRAAR